MPSNWSDLVWVSGIEARIQDDLSLTECVTSALDTLKGTFYLYAANFDVFVSDLPASTFDLKQIFSTSNVRTLSMDFHTRTPVRFTIRFRLRK